MDNFDDLSAVNLSDDGDVKHSVSSKESDESDSMYHNIQCDQNVNSNMKIRDGEFKKITDLTTDDIYGLEFGSEEEAYDFYEKYAKCRGFVVRKDEVKRNVNGKVIMRQFVCNRQGLRNKKHFKRVDRKRDHRRITRVECQARLRVHYNLKKSIWTVTCFEVAHNHELTPSRYVHLFPAYRGLTDADKAQVDSLHSYGTKTCHIMGYMVAQKGGHASVGFTKKDLYNYFDSQMRGEIKDGDVAAALSYLRGKADNDPMLYAKFATNSDGRLKQIFWADGCSRSDFLCFGDVLAFDTTYRKNKYNYPLVIFSGCNHHSQTVIFGCALVSDETIDTYKWVLNSFLEAMGNKHPKTVVTDGDGAMREAIKHVFPDTCHRLCAWHLHKNACENVKSSAFLMDFKKAMYSDFTREEFEDFWMNMVEKHGLVGNKWVSKTYENRSSWATAYFRDIFFGRIRTTSQCEAINSIMKTYVRKKCSIFEFIHNFEQALREYRNNELVADFKSLYSDPVLTTSLYEIEKAAAKIYTAEVFMEVKEQIVLVSTLIVTTRVVIGNQLILKLTKYCHRNVETTVVYDTSRSIFYCECRRFESRGIPCSHIFCAMKEEHVDHIPDSLILTRWTKKAKIDFLSSDSSKGVDSDVMELARFGAYCGACTRFCKIASKKKGLYNEVMNDILKLIDKYEKLEDSVDTPNPSGKHFCDPNVVKTKGAPKKSKIGMKRSRHCSNCTSTKHNVKTCPVRVGTNAKSMNDDKLSQPECPKSNIAADSDTNIMTSSESKGQDHVISTKPKSHIDNDTNIMTSSESKGQDHVISTKPKSYIDNKGKGKASGCCNKQKEEKILKHKSPVVCSSGGHPIMSQVQPMLTPMQHMGTPMQHMGTPMQAMVHHMVPPMQPMVPPMQPMVPQVQFPTYGYAASSQGLSNLPNIVGVPFYRHNTQVPILSQAQQYYHGPQVDNNDTSYFGLLQEVMKNEGQMKLQMSNGTGSD